MTEAHRDLPPGLPVEIDYRRAGGEALLYRQWLVHAHSDGIVTLQESTPLTETKRVGGEPILAPASPVVWFTFEGAWHDIGAFHLPDGRLTGHYANVLTPVRLEPPTEDGWRWSTMDLCLDVWRSLDGQVRILDEDDLREAERIGAVNDEMAGRARDEAAELVGRARNGEWPPALVGEWPLDRARDAVSRAGVDLGAVPTVDGG